MRQKIKTNKWKLAIFSLLLVTAFSIGWLSFRSEINQFSGYLANTQNWLVVKAEAQVTNFVDFRLQVFADDSRKNLVYSEDFADVAMNGNNFRLVAQPNIRTRLRTLSGRPNYIQVCVNTQGAKSPDGFMGVTDGLADCDSGSSSHIFDKVFCPAKDESGPVSILARAFGAVILKPSNSTCPQAIKPTPDIDNTAVTNNDSEVKNSQNASGYGGGTTTVVNNPVTRIEKPNQNLAINGDLLSITGGNTVQLPTYQSSSLTDRDNQTLNLTGSVLSISGGNSIDLRSLASITIQNIFPSAGGGNGGTTIISGGGGGSGTVTSVAAGAGLQATTNPITTSGSISVNSPTCAAAQALSWNGSAFVCVPVTTVVAGTAGIAIVNGGTLDAPIFNVQAANGLTANALSDAVELGGSLTSTTTLVLNSNSLIIDGSSIDTTFAPTGAITINTGAPTGTKGLTITGDLDVTGVIDPMALLFSGDTVTNLSTDGYRIGIVAADTQRPIYVSPLSNATNAFQVRRADNTTSVLTVDTLNQRVGVGTATPLATLQNAGSTLFSTLALGDFASGGSIGSAASTVDVATSISIPQTTAGQTLTIPAPTNATAGRLVYISNTGTTAFTLLGSPVGVSESRNALWNGSSWVLLGDGTGSGGSESTTANNGLTLTGFNVALGGALTASTNIALGASNNFSIVGSGGGAVTALFQPNGMAIGGTVDTGSQLSLGGTGAAGRLSLYENGGGLDSIRIAAPGALAASYTLTLPGDDGTSGQFLQTDGSGLLTWASIGGGGVTASNGLTLVGSDVRLGGILSQSTTVDTDSYSMIFGNLSTAAGGTQAFIFGNSNGSASSSSSPKYQIGQGNQLNGTATGFQFGNNNQLIDAATGFQSGNNNSGSENSSNNFFYGSNNTVTGYGAGNQLFGSSNSASLNATTNYLYGTNNTASGTATSSIAFGSGNQLNSTSQNSLVVGASNVSTVADNFVFGSSNTANASGFIFGGSNSMDTAGFVVGKNNANVNYHDGADLLLFGNNNAINTGSGTNSAMGLFLGNQNTVNSGVESSVIGYQNTIGTGGASPTASSYVIGQSNSVINNGSGSSVRTFAMGTGNNIQNSTYNFVFGHDNTLSDAGSSDTSGNAPVYLLGNQNTISGANTRRSWVFGYGNTVSSSRGINIIGKSNQAINSSQDVNLFGNDNTADGVNNASVLGSSYSLTSSESNNVFVGYGLSNTFQGNSTGNYRITSPISSGTVFTLNGPSVDTGTLLQFNSNALTTGMAIDVTNSASYTGGGVRGMVNISNTNTASTGALMWLQSAATATPAGGIVRYQFANHNGGSGVYVNSLTANGNAMQIDANSVVDSGSGLVINANALGNGSGLRVNSTSTNELVNGLLRVDAPNPYTGVMARFSSGTSTGRAMQITADSLTSGYALLVESSSTGNLSNGAVKFEFTGNHTGTVFDLSSNTTGGVLQSINAPNLNGGDALRIFAPAITGGNGINMIVGGLTSGTGIKVAATGTNGVAILGAGNGSVIGISGTNGTGTAARFSSSTGLAVEAINTSNGDVATFTNNDGTCTLDPGTGLTCPSDMRLKTDISNYDGSGILNNISKLRVTTFHWKSNPDASLTTGLIAQEVETVFPDLVGRVNSPNGLSDQRTISLGGFVPYLISAIQEQQKMIKNLQNNLSTGLDSVIEKVENGVAYMKGIITESLTVGSKDKRTGITLFDSVTGEEYCLRVEKGETKTIPGVCAVVEGNADQNAEPSTPATPVNETTVTEPVKSTEEQLDSTANENESVPVESQAAADENAVAIPDSLGTPSGWTPVSLPVLP